jgi:hypothetical protein
MKKLRIVILGHLVIENGYRMMNKSKTPLRKVRKRHDLQSRRGI